MFQKYKLEVSKILKKTIGPLFDIVPISVSRDVNIANKSVEWDKWNKGGLTLAKLIQRSQQQTNWHEVAVERLRSEKFEMQFTFKHMVRMDSCAVTGRVTCTCLSYV